MIRLYLALLQLEPGSFGPTGLLSFVITAAAFLWDACRVQMPPRAFSQGLQTDVTRPVEACRRGYADG